MGRLLAIDYGRKRVGIAVTDPLQMIASGLTTVPAHEILDFLAGYFTREKVDLVVLGYPLKMNDEESESMKYVRQFETAFRRKFPDIPVEHEDERFTSKMAVRAMVEGGMKKKERRKKENIDRISAAIILQSYMEHRENRK
jgi:putative Holliday junction resolvase